MSSNKPTPPTPYYGRHQQPQACAACKYQRRKCVPSCPLAPYFPPDRQRDFLNAQKLFGVSNIIKLINDLSPEQRDIAMQCIIYEANARALDPVRGCYGFLLRLQHQIELTQAQLCLVEQRLHFFRNQRLPSFDDSTRPLFPPGPRLKLELAQDRGEPALFARWSAKRGDEPPSFVGTVYQRGEPSSFAPWSASVHECGDEPPSFVSTVHERGEPSSFAPWSASVQERGDEPPPFGATVHERGEPSSFVRWSGNVQERGDEPPSFVGGSGNVHERGESSSFVRWSGNVEERGEPSSVGGSGNVHERNDPPSFVRWPGNVQELGDEPPSFVGWSGSVQETFLGGSTSFNPAILDEDTVVLDDQASAQSSDRLVIPGDASPTVEPHKDSQEESASPMPPTDEEICS